MKLFMPMAGQATRFNKEPQKTIIKPLIEVKGKKLYEWALSSFGNSPIDITFLVQESHVSLKTELINKYPQSRIIELNRATSGPGETLTFAENFLDDSPLIICDCDLYFRSLAFEEFIRAPDKKTEFAVLTFASGSDRYSYVRVEEGKVVGIAEKKVISGEAVCGSYYFSSGNMFRDLLKKVNGSLDREIFLSDVVAEAINEGREGRTFACDEHVSLGTPEELSENSYRLPSTTPDKS